MFGQHPIGSMTFIPYHPVFTIMIYHIIAIIYCCLPIFAMILFEFEKTTRHQPELHKVTFKGATLALAAVLELLHDIALYNRCIVNNILEFVYVNLYSIDLHQAYGISS